jgi:hypothetical protein
MDSISQQRITQRIVPLKESYFHSTKKIPRLLISRGMEKLLRYLPYQPLPQTTESRSLAVLFKLSAIEISVGLAVPEAFS